jgi:hypothetical protein
MKSRRTLAGLVVCRIRGKKNMLKLLVRNFEMKFQFGIQDVK